MRYRHQDTGTGRSIDARTGVSGGGRRPREVTDVPFGDLLYQLAHGVAGAQERLDADAVAAARSLADTTVDVVPRITRTIAPDGTVSTATAPAEERTLLELGFEPARYRFEEATVEVEVDASFADSAEPGPSLRASTADAAARRRFTGGIETNTRLSARLQPTPLPARAAGEMADDTGGNDGGNDAD